MQRFTLALVLSATVEGFTTSVRVVPSRTTTGSRYGRSYSYYCARGGGLSFFALSTSSTSSKKQTIDFDRSPLKTIFNREREFLFTTRKNIRNFEWTEQEAEELFESILDINDQNPENVLELNNITIMRKEKAKEKVVERKSTIRNSGVYYDVHDGQQRLVTLCLYLAALRDILYKKYPNAKASATEVAQCIYPETAREVAVTRIELRENGGNKWLKFILSRTDCKKDHDIMSKLPDSKSWKKSLPECDGRILTVYKYFLERFDDLQDEEKILNLYDSFRNDVYLLVSIPSDTIIARNIIMNQGKGKNMEPVDEFKGIVCFNWNEDEKVQDSTLQSWNELCDDVGRYILQDTCLILAQQSLKSRCKKNDEVLWMDKFVRESITSSNESDESGGDALFKTEIFPASKALTEFRNGDFSIDEAIISHPPSLNFLKSAAEIQTCKEIEMVVLYLIRCYKHAVHEEQKKQIMSRLKDIEGIALWMMLTKPKPKERFQRCLCIREEYEMNDNAASTSSLLSEIEKKDICNTLETNDFGKGGIGRKKAIAILERLNEYQLVTITQSKVQPMTSSLHIEHVLPQNHSNVSYWKLNWPDTDEVSTWMHRLGNLVLLNQKTNCKIGNAPFEIKKDHLKESPYPLTKDIANASTWDIQALKDNHNKYINLVKEVWKF